MVYNQCVYGMCVLLRALYTHLIKHRLRLWRNAGYSIAHCSPWGKGCEDSIDIIARPAGSAFMVSSRARAAHFASNPLQTSLKALFFGVALFCLWARRLGDSIAPWYNTSVFNEARTLERALALKRALSLGRALKLKRARALKRALALERALRLGRR